MLIAKTTQSTVLYLCLEYSKIRIQNHLYEMTDEPTERLHFALMSDTIGSGLKEQIVKFFSEHQDTKIIFIDTLKKTRSDSPESTYATDYKELSVLKSIADKHSVVIVLVHHLRKTKAADSFTYDSRNDRTERLCQWQLCSFGIKARFAKRYAVLCRQRY